VNNRAVKKKLSAGYEDPANVEALSGFEVGATVIVLGQSGLKDGAMVRSVNAMPAALTPPKAEAGREMPAVRPAPTEPAKATKS
jgi:membrane fusion protein (multidrug efflux system)